MEIVNPQIESLRRFKDVTEKKASGATYTPRELAIFVAKQILANSNLSKRQTLRIFDPAAGEGELLLALIDELKQSGYLNIHAHGFDTNELATAKAISRIKLAHPDVTTDIQTKDFLSLLSNTESNLTLVNQRELKLFLIDVFDFYALALRLKALDQAFLPEVPDASSAFLANLTYEAYPYPLWISAVTLVNQLALTQSLTNKERVLLQQKIVDFLLTTKRQS
jgi:hypothetical protein